ncbi:MAG: glycoside hydrolase family 15 protein, partial [Actinomycetes bacterium]
MRAYGAHLRRPPDHLPGLSRAEEAAVRARYWLSANVIKASMDKTFPGAVAAGLAAPWGRAVSAGSPVNGLAPYFGSYREVFARDAYEAFTGFLLDGDLATARSIVNFLFDRQQLPDGRMPRNSLLNGKAAPDTGGIQLDETAWPILMAWQAGMAGQPGIFTKHVEPAANYLVAHGPSYGVERWEEQTGYSPSTIAAEIAGLVAAGHIAALHHNTGLSRLYLATADEFQRTVIPETVTSNGPDSASPYFLRLSKNANPDTGVTYQLGNGNTCTYDQRRVIDAGFLELTRLGALSQSLPVVANSLGVV